jgi:transposase-like protein
MPWKERSVVEERMRFVLRLNDGESMASLCREFGISRVTGYKIYERYKECGLEGLLLAAANTLIQLQGAILGLSNAILGDIATQMQANEADLTRCTKGLTDALKDITNVKTVIAAVTSILTVVAKIIPLL